MAQFDDLKRWAAEQSEAVRRATEHLEPAARIAAEQSEAVRRTTEHLEPAARIAAEQSEAVRRATEHLEPAARIAAEQSEAVRRATEHLEPAARIAAEQLEAVRIAAEQLELVRIAAAEQLELARIAAERFEPSLLAEQLRVARTATAEWFEPSLQQFKAVQIAAERFEPSLLAEQCEQLLAGLPRLSPELFGGAWADVAEAVERLERTEVHPAAAADPDQAVEEMAKDAATVHEAAPSEVQGQVKTRLFGLVVRRLTEIAKHPTIKKLRWALWLLSLLGVTPTLPDLMSRVGVPTTQELKTLVTASRDRPPVPPPETLRLGDWAEGLPTIVQRAGSADVEQFAGWLYQVNAAVAEAEQAAAEAEQSAAASGGWFLRLTNCLGARDRVRQAISRVHSLTIAGNRPESIPAEAGVQAFERLRNRLDEADQRAGVAYDSIERPR